MPQPPYDIHIGSGVLRLGSQTIFLKNITSVRIDVSATRKFRGIGVLLFVVFLTLGFFAFAYGIGSEGSRSALGFVAGLTLLPISIACLVALSRDESSYTLVIVTAAGESNLLTDSAYAPLKEVEDSIVREIATA